MLSPSVVLLTLFLLVWMAWGTKGVAARHTACGSGVCEWDIPSGCHPFNLGRCDRASPAPRRFEVAGPSETRAILSIERRLMTDQCSPPGPQSVVQSVHRPQFEVTGAVEWLGRGIRLFLDQDRVIVRTHRCHARLHWKY